MPNPNHAPVTYNFNGYRFKTASPPVPQWTLFPPIVYRYMDQQYIDEFFATGRLMLSSFHRFKQHADEQREDSLEGQNLVVGRYQDRDVFTAQIKHGEDALVFCTSVREGDDLMRQFGCNGYFRITDTHLFGRAVGKVLTGFVRGLEGHCTYRDHHVIEKQLTASIAATFNIDPAAGPPEEVVKTIMGVAGAQPYFSKRRQFSQQCEYRLLWLLDHDVRDILFVDCPEAIQFCEKITGVPSRTDWDLPKPGEPGWWPLNPASGSSGRS